MNSKQVTITRKELRGIVRAEMFGQLTSGLESAWNKLKGEGFASFPLFFFYVLIKLSSIKWGFLFVFLEAFEIP